MAGRYRALLIGNSTYPADEHNLQVLKGPVKDIAVLNRALADGSTGMFADSDVALLPEVTSTRAIRALGRFFGEAGRDDILLFFFSGHGKVDQAGRLHLCMQDTESTDLLSTAVSSARLNEFADASHARNVVIILDCCFSGAFRGGDAPDAIAGPGRYVLASCRGTQLANDATMENSTSYFTQHLVDALLGSAVDHDGDGYITFSELHAYVDRRLRETGKQIPQRRVNGDGDLRLARRPQAAAPPDPAVIASQPVTGPPAQLTGAQSPAADPRAIAEPAMTAKGGGSSAAGPPGRRGRGRPRRPVVLTAAIAAAASAGITIGAIALAGGGDLRVGGPSGYVSAQKHIATAPWRLQVNAHSAGTCGVTLIDASSGAEVRNLTQDDPVSGEAIFQVHELGTFRWRYTDPGCLIAPLDEATISLPFSFPDAENDTPADTSAFTTPASKLTVQITAWDGDECDLDLYDAVSGAEVDSVQAKHAHGDTWPLRTEGSKELYLRLVTCNIHVSAG